MLTALLAAVMIATTVPIADAAGTGSLCSERLRRNDRVSLPHNGHYDTFILINAYNGGLPPYGDHHTHKFENRTHHEYLFQPCGDVYKNHPGF